MAAPVIVQRRDRQPLAIQTLRTHVPSAFADRPSADRSDRYLFVDTAEVIDLFGKAGFHPVWASESRTRTPGHAGYTRHMIRFAPEGRQLQAVDDVRPELVWTNSHNGSSLAKLAFGLFRLVCLNGLIVDEGTLQNAAFRHTERWRDAVIDGVYRVIEEVEDGAVQTIDAMSRYITSPEQRLQIAQRASSLRWGDDAPVTAARLLIPQRRQDEPDDLWHVFNRVQENIVQGGQQYWGDRMRSMRTRPVNGIDAIDTINRGLWATAVSVLPSAN